MQLMKLIRIYFESVWLFILGVDGIDGVDVPKKNDISELTRLGFKCGNVTTQAMGSTYVSTYRFCGKPAIPGTNGGDGGCGGDGGESGEIQIFGLKNQSNIVQFQENGMKKPHSIQ